MIHLYSVSIFSYINYSVSIFLILEFTKSTFGQPDRRNIPQCACRCTCIKIMNDLLPGHLFLFLRYYATEPPLIYIINCWFLTTFFPDQRPFYRISQTLDILSVRYYWINKKVCRSLKWNTHSFFYPLQFSFLTVWKSYTYATHSLYKIPSKKCEIIIL